MHITRLAAAVALLAPALVAAPAAAAIPSTAHVEGTIAATGGGPAADGSYVMTFAIYPTSTGGTAVWSEGPVAIDLKGGRFAWVLGGKTPLSAAALSAPASWLGVVIGNEAELPRQPLGSVLFAQRAAVAEGLDCSGCLKVGALDPAVLQPYVKAGDLAPYVKTNDLGAFAKTVDLDDYAKVSALAKVAASGSYNDLKDKPKLADVATTGAYGDLTDKPIVPKLGTFCGTGLVLVGYKNDGSLSCAPIQIPPDYLDEVSNGLLTNQFVDTAPGGVNVAIPDGIGAGQKNDLVFPDIGVAQALWINVELTNSDLASLSIELFAPATAEPYILYSKGKPGEQTLKAAFNKDTPIVLGDINKDWVGKNPKGTWSLVVKDPNKNQMNGTTDGAFTWSIGIQTLSTKKVQVKGNVILDGKIYGAGTCGNGIVEKGEGCDDGNNTDGDGCSALCSAAEADKSCAAILAKNAAAKTGWYTIDLDGATGPHRPRAVVCDMATEGGGWTRFLHVSDPDGTYGVTVDTWNDAVTFAASAGIKEWLVKTYLKPQESTDVGSAFHNGWTMNVAANSQGRAFTFFRHATTLTYNAHRENGAGRISSTKLLAGSNCKAWHPTYNNGAYLWHEHRWSNNHSLGWMWMSHCGTPAYHMLLVNHDYDYGEGKGRTQTGVGTDQSPSGTFPNYDEDGAAYEFFFR